MATAAVEQALAELDATPASVDALAPGAVVPFPPAVVPSLSHTRAGVRWCLQCASFFPERSALQPARIDHRAWGRRRGARHRRLKAANLPVQPVDAID